MQVSTCYLTALACFVGDDKNFLCFLFGTHVAGTGYVYIISYTGFRLTESSS